MPSRSDLTAEKWGRFTPMSDEIFHAVKAMFDAVPLVGATGAPLGRAGHVALVCERMREDRMRMIAAVACPYCGQAHEPIGVKSRD